MVITVRNETLYPAVMEASGTAYYIIPYKYASLIGPERSWHTVDLVSGAGGEGQIGMSEPSLHGIVAK